MSLSLSRLSGSYGDDDTKENKNEKRFQRDLISKLSNGILDGVHAILFFNGVFSFIFSVLYLSFKLEYIFEDNVNVIFIPILINKFYLLTFNYYCAYISEETKNDELISNSTLISLYMGIWDLIIYIIKAIFSGNENLRNIFIFQIIFSSIPSLIAGLYIFILGFCYLCIACFSCEKREFIGYFEMLYCFLSFFLCGGGLWFDFGHPFYCDCCCCDYLSCCYCECCESLLS